MRVEASFEDHFESNTRSHDAIHHTGSPSTATQIQSVTIIYTV